MIDKSSFLLKYCVFELAIFIFLISRKNMKHTRDMNKREENLTSNLFASNRIKLVGGKSYQK